MPSAVVDQQAGKPSDLPPTDQLSGGSMLGIVLLALVVLGALAFFAEKRSWFMPGLFLIVFVVWPLCAYLSS